MVLSVVESGGHDMRSKRSDTYIVSETRPRTLSSASWGGVAYWMAWDGILAGAKFPWGGRGMLVQNFLAPTISTLRGGGLIFIPWSPPRWLFSTLGTLVGSTSLRPPGGGGVQRSLHLPPFPLCHTATLVSILSGLDYILYIPPIAHNRRLPVV